MQVNPSRNDALYTGAGTAQHVEAGGITDKPSPDSVSELHSEERAELRIRSLFIVLLKK